MALHPDCMCTKGRDNSFGKGYISLRLLVESAITVRRQLRGRQGNLLTYSLNGTLRSRLMQDEIGVADVSLRGLESPKEGDQKTFWSPSFFDYLL